MVKGKVLFFFLIFLYCCNNTVLAAVPEGWGAGWSEITLLGKASQTSGPANVIKDSQGNMHVLWLNSIDGNNQAFYLKMGVNGEILKEKIQLTDMKQWKIRQLKALKTFDEKILLLLEVINNGRYQIQAHTFDPEVSVIIEKDELFSFERPIQGLNGILSHSGELNLVWADLRSSNYEIYYARFSPDMELLLEPTRLSNSPEVSISVNLAVDSRDKIHLVWNEYNGARWDLKYQVFSKTGEAISPVQSLGKSIEYPGQTIPQIAIDSEDRVHIVNISSLKGGFGIIDYNVFYSLLDTAKNTLVDDLRVSDHGQGFYNVSAVHLELDAKNQAHIVWADDMFGGLNNFYAVINNGKIVVPQTRLAVVSESQWLPTLVLEDENKHLFFMGFDSGGQYNIGYMNTVNPARIVYFNRIGIDVKHPFVSIIYRFIGLLFYSGLGIIMNFLPLAVAFLVILVLDRYIKNIHWSVKFLLMVGIILLFSGSSFGVTPEAFSSFYEFLAIILSIAIIFLLTCMVKLYFDDGMTLILLEVLWLFAYLLLMQIPAGYTLLR